MQVRQLEDVEKRGKGGLMTTQMVKGFTQKLKNLSQQKETKEDEAEEA